MSNYAISIVWSEEDAVFLATHPELAGCVADGDSPEEALTNLKVIAQEWIETAQSLGRDLPSPRTLKELEAETTRLKEQNAQFIHQQIEAAVQGVLPKIAADIEALIRERQRLESNQLRLTGIISRNFEESLSLT